MCVGGGSVGVLVGVAVLVGGCGYVCVCVLVYG